MKLSQQFREAVFELGSNILAFHASADWSVPPLPQHAVFLLHIRIFHIIVRTKFSIWYWLKIKSHKF